MIIMIPEYFYDKRCSVYTYTEVTIKGVLKKQKVLVYDKIGCDFRPKPKNNANETNIAEDTIEQRYILDVLGDKTQINKKDYVEIYNVINGTEVLIGEYIVMEQPMIYPDLNGVINNIQVELKQRSV